MKIKVKIIARNELQEIDVPEGTIISELFQKLHLGPGPFVVLKNNAPIPSDYMLNDRDELSILQVISGG